MCVRYYYLYRRSARRTDDRTIGVHVWHIGCSGCRVGMPASVPLSIYPSIWAHTCTKFMNDNACVWVRCLFSHCSPLYVRHQGNLRLSMDTKFYSTFALLPLSRLYYMHVYVCCGWVKKIINTCDTLVCVTWNGELAWTMCRLAMYSALVGESWKFVRPTPRRFSFYTFSDTLCVTTKHV